MIEGKKYTEKFYKEHENGSYISAQEILPTVNELFKPKSVIDIGCGIAYWLRVWNQDFHVPEIMGVEGPYISPDLLQIPIQWVKFHDLKLPLQINKRFDLAMSLEVAEHLPVECADVFIKSLTDASDIVLFSAAIIGQEGNYHINEQMPEYWAKIFDKYGYKPIDYLRPRIWANEKIEWWYRQNILFYVKSNRIKDFPQLNQAYELTDPNYLFRVQPWLYLDKQNYIIKTSKFLGYLRWRGHLLKKRILEKFEKA
ncbi:MAG: hypothetical protein JST58_15935 [Bacteroidetes bacterium]|nr:hypothetical protein [Bacteroidota bacterium]